MTNANEPLRFRCRNLGLEADDAARQFGFEVLIVERQIVNALNGLVRALARLAAADLNFAFRVDCCRRSARR
jgi:hypothetical protein